MVDYVNFEILHIENILGKTSFGIHNSLVILCRKKTSMSSNANLDFINHSIELDAAEFNL